MTFNEGVQIDTSTTSTSGSGGGRRLAIGGGLGGLLVVVVAMLLGVDPGGVLSQQPLDTRDHVAPGFDLSQCRTGADANRFVQCRVVATGNSVDAVWKPLLPGYTRPHMRLFSGQVGTGCGPASSEVGPFYCPVDKTAYFDTDFFQVLVTQFGSSGGPFAEEYVVAHEYGHHVQNLLGVLGRAQQGAQGAAGSGVRTELQADCYLVIGGGGTSKPTNALLFPQPRCQVITGVGDFDPAIRRKPSIFVLEDAPWSAFRDRDNPYGFVAFDVDPGQPGGTTSIKATYYAVTGPFGGLTVIDQFTLTKPRGG